MTFEEWQKTREYTEDLSEVSGWATPGYKYACLGYIDDLEEDDEAPGRWQVTTERWSDISDDLEAMERVLYDQIAHDMGWITDEDYN